LAILPATYSPDLRAGNWLFRGLIGAGKKKFDKNAKYWHDFCCFVTLVTHTIKLHKKATFHNRGVVFLLPKS
jgi:hypothetical protein